MSGYFQRERATLIAAASAVCLIFGLVVGTYRGLCNGTAGPGWARSAFSGLPSVNQGFAGGPAASGTDNWARESGPSTETPARSSFLPERVPVLMYHDVGFPGAPLVVPPDAFREQMDYLVSEGYSTITLDDLLKAMAGQDVPLPSKPVVITFDDGYEGVYRFAYPVMKQRGLSGTVFIISGMVGTKGYMTWDNIRELCRHGFTAGSHTVSHPDLTALDVHGIAREVGASRRAIAAETGQEAIAFCYPAGRFSPLVIEEVRAAGYLGAVTTAYGFVGPGDDMFTLRRIRVDGRDSLTVFSAKLAGR